MTQHNAPRPSRATQKRILAKCLIATLGIHLAAFFVFYQFPPGLPAAWHSMFISALPSLKMLSRVEEEQMLEEFFDPFPALPSLVSSAYDHTLSYLEGERSTPQEEESAPLTSIVTAAELETKNQVFSNSTLHTRHPLQLAHAPDSTAPLILPEQISLPAPVVDYQLSGTLTHFPPLLSLETDESAESPLFFATPEHISAALRGHLDLPSFLSTAAPFPQVKEALPAPQTPLLPSLEKPLTPLLAAVAGALTPLLTPEEYALPAVRFNEIPGNAFDADIRFTKAGREGGYLFSVTLKPRKGANLRSMQHNYTFLLDRTNSIEKHHFTAFKKATLRAIGKLQPEDNFNIVIFDRKAVYFSEEPVPYCSEAKQAAEKFLNKQKHGSLFAAADLYQTLPKVLPRLGSEEEVDTLILLTDGTSDNKAEQQQRAIAAFLDKIKPQATLYTVAVGHQNDLRLLEMVGRCSGGGLLHSDTYSAFGRRLAGLIYRIRNPIAKELKLSLVSQDPEAKIALHAPSATVLYIGQPLEVVGRAEELKPFTLVIEGVCEGEPLRIKKMISFDRAKQDSAYVKKLWGAERNLAQYEALLEKGRATLHQTARKQRR